MKTPRSAVLHCAALLLLAAGMATAQDIEPTLPERDDQTTREPKEKRFDVRLSFGLSYDDNILNLRDDTLDEFDSGVFPENRFLIDSVDDVVAIPGVQLSYSVVPKTRRRNRLRLSVDGFRYLNNSIKDFERYRLDFEKDLTDTRDDLTSMESEYEEATQKRLRTIRSYRLANRSRLRFRYSYTPTRYNGQLRDKNDFRQFKSAESSSQGWDVRWLQRLNTGDENRFSLELRYGQGERDYNVDFEERDSDEDRLTIGGHWYSLGDDAYWDSALLVHLVNLDSNTSLIGQVSEGGTIEDDVSYESEAVQVYVGRRWYREKGGSVLRKQNRLWASLYWRTKEYTTDNLEDLSHFGRSDDRVTVDLWYSRALTDRAVLDFGLEYTTQQSNLEKIIGILRNEPSDYDKVVFVVRYSLYLGWRKKAAD